MKLCTGIILKKFFLFYSRMIIVYYFYASGFMGRTDREEQIGKMTNVIVQYKRFHLVELEKAEITFTILVKILRRIINLQLCIITMA